MSDAKFDTLECSRLVVRNPLKPDAGYELTLSAGDDHAGLWVRGAGGDAGPLVCVYQQGGVACVGLYADGRAEPAVVNLGLGVAGGGEPFVQVALPGESEAHTLTATKLIKLIRWARAEEERAAKPKRRPARKAPPGKGKKK